MTIVFSFEIWMTSNFSNRLNKIADYSCDQTLPQLFEAQALLTPDNIAVVFGDQQLTYKELNEQSNQLAYYLRRNYQEKQSEELRPDTLIALCLNRSLEMIIAILGVLKSGAAYVPIDPNSPPERTNSMLNNTGTVLLITNCQLVGIQRLEHEGLQLILVDDKPYRHESKSNLLTETQPNDLAYVIYTSGTTGVPKGVMQIHANVMRLFTATQAYFAFSSVDVWTLYHSYTFDFSVWEMWGALLYGGMLVIPSTEDVRDMHSFYKLCVQHRVSILNQTPSAFQAFAQQAFLERSNDLALRYIIFGGEMLQVAKLRPWWEVMGTIYPKLVNMYGITETTVHATLKELSVKDACSVIGRPLGDLKAYVLNEQGDLVSEGEIGELYLSGAGLARGYLNQPELSQERFIPNRFATELDKSKGYHRLYKTGDLVRWLEHEELEYIGRNDSQVKIRGYRIELGEIEQALLSHPLITQSVVIVRQHINTSGKLPYLVAYFIGRRKLSEATLKIFLAQRLPSYMVPCTLIQVASFPLTTNGKLDRKVLSEMVL